MNNAKPSYRILQGKISHLHTEDINVHYLKSIRQQQEIAGTVAVLQAAMGEAGAVNSAQAATDEGDPVNGFTMQLAGKTIRGSFWKTTFQNGDHVQVIGYERHRVFEAVAVIKPDEKMIWMQPHCERGTRSQTSVLLKRCGWFALAMFLATMLLDFHKNLPVWYRFANFFCLTAVVLFPTVGMSWSDFMSFAGEMDAVGEALGWPEPENIDLFKSTKLARKDGRPELPMGVYYY